MIETMELSSILPHFPIHSSNQQTIIKSVDLLSTTVVGSENTQTSLHKSYNLVVGNTTSLYTSIRAHKLKLVSQPSKIKNSNNDPYQFNFFVFSQTHLL